MIKDFDQGLGVFDALLHVLRAHDGCDGGGGPDGGLCVEESDELLGGEIEAGAEGGDVAFEFEEGGGEVGGGGARIALALGVGDGEGAGHREHKSWERDSFRGFCDELESFGD